MDLSHDIEVLRTALDESNNHRKMLLEDNANLEQHIKMLKKALEYYITNDFMPDHARQALEYIKTLEEQ